MNASPTDRKAVVIGGGPAGLTAAFELSRRGVQAVVLEADEQVGGLARTVDYKGYLFDIGGHRFFTKWDAVNSIWREVLGDKFMLRTRLSRIYFRGRFFHYPLRPKEVLLGLGPIESIHIIGSYLRSSLFPTVREENLEEWVCNRFGRRLFQIFFKTYTEKVWGVPCTSIGAEWAAQRIRGLSLKAAVYYGLFPKKKPKLRTLINEFHYPERGPGQMWETLASRLAQAGCPVLRKRPVARLRHGLGRITHVITRGQHGEEAFETTNVISSMPIRDLVNTLDPHPPDDILKAANHLRYRDFLIVSLIINREQVAPDNWIYVHEPGVRVGRIQFFKNWSPAMVPDPRRTCVGMEYFVFENDDLWSRPDAKLLELARREIVQLGLVRPEEIEDGTVVRMQKAYPMYDGGWAERVFEIRKYAERNLANLQLVGRNGMHKYNNQDHSMMTGLCAARNICGANYDLWTINSEPAYHEEVEEIQEERAPGKWAPETQAF